MRIRNRQPTSPRGEQRWQPPGYIFLRSAVVLGLLALAICACSKERKDILGTAKKLYSQRDEEVMIRDFLQDRRDGFYVDVGCAWPKKNSTTYYLEKHLGWVGIGIDALPEFAPSWAKERPQSQFYNFYVSDHSGAVTPFYRANGLGSRQSHGYRGLSSGQKKRIFKGKEVHQDEELQIPTITLNKILDENEITKIDFLSMDIEEAEPPALRGFDIDRFRPDLVCIEASPSVQEEILQYFEAHDYERIERYLAHDEINWYFEPKN